MNETMNDDMIQLDDRLDSPSLQWYVMLNGNPRMIDFQLKRENALRQQRRGRDKLQLEYFIPFMFLTHILEETDDKNAEAIRNVNFLRQDFHDFVFIRTTPKGIKELLRSSWNRDMRIRLRHYRNSEHAEIILCDRDMETLIKIFSEHRIRFTIGLPTPEVYPEEIVEITEEGIFKGQQARVIAVKHTADGINLTLGIKMFDEAKELRLFDKTPRDIQTEVPSDDIIGMDFINEAERMLLDILSRRVNHKETDDTRRQDANILNHLFLYSYIDIIDASVSARFLSLMLVCSCLRFDQESSLALAKRIQTVQSAGNAFSPYIQAYLNISLYIATRDADYRTLAKQSVQQSSSDVSESLRRLLSLASRLHSKRKHKR